jgi:PhnB protein
MKNNVKPIPEGYHSVTPYLMINGASKAIEFYKQAFGAKEIGRLSMGQQVAHCELEIGDSRIMLADANPEWGHKAPEALGGSPVSICLYVEDVDAVYKKAIAAGAKADRNGEVKDQFYGDRSGSLVDPFGHKWTIATHIENVSFPEMDKRMQAMYKEQHA